MEKRFAMVFPGQGSQTIGMANQLVEDFPEVKTYFSEASGVLGYDLWQRVAHGPAEELNRTEVTQPALLVTSYSVWNVWQQQTKVQPTLMAGHSLGEYTALVCAKALDFKTAVKIVAKRGQLMQQSVAEGDGAMAAIIGLDDGRVEEICQQARDNEVLMPANYNTIGQVVIAGHKAAVDRAIVLANDAGAKLAKVLQVSVPSHCALMEPAAKLLAEELKNVVINPPQIDIVNNVDVAIHRQPDAIKDALVRQLYNPVRWVDSILKISEAGAKTILECGPGRILCGLIKRLDRSINCLPIYDKDTLVNAEKNLEESLC